MLSVETDPARDVVRLVVADDGVGFECAGRAIPDEQEGWGLVGMAERAEVAGAHFQIKSRPGHGTQVIVEAPR